MQGSWLDRMTASAGRGAVTDVAGVRVGRFTHSARQTGCTVVLLPEATVAGVDVRGAAPGTRETDLPDPGSSVQEVHAIPLSGGSAFGLDAASSRWIVLASSPVLSPCSLTMTILTRPAC